MYSHGTLRPKSPLPLTRFSFITTLPQLACLFKNLVNQVAINLITWPVTSNSLFKVFGWRSTTHSVWTWLGFGLTTAKAFTSFLISQLMHKLINISQYWFPVSLVIMLSPDERNHLKKDILWAFLSCLLRYCYSFLTMKRTLSDDLYLERLFIDFEGSLKETCVQRSPCI